VDECGDLSGPDIADIRKRHKDNDIKGERMAKEHPGKLIELYWGCN
jgi:hypothetical protein